MKEIFYFDPVTYNIYFHILLLLQVNIDIKSKEILCMKLLNYILQPTIYDDIREVARDWVVEENMDKYLVRTKIIDLI